MPAVRPGLHLISKSHLQGPAEHAESRYARTDYGRITWVDADGTVFGTFGDGSTFIPEGRMVRDLERVEK